MQKFLFSYLLFTLISINLYPQTKYSINISYMISDFKYNKKDGLKICDARNTTHTYDEENAQEICKRINHYSQIFTKISCISLNR